MRTVGEAVRDARRRLEGSRSPSLDAEVLLGYVLSRSRAWVLAHSDAPLSGEQRSHFQSLVDRRSEGEPVAYLTGRVEWYGMELEVTRDVLIPRPESELVLERAVQIAREESLTRLADIGTGSGALAIGLARSLPSARIVAVDTSRAALRVARGNAERLGVHDQVAFVEGHLVGPLRDPPQFIVANLPYLSDEMMENLERDVRFEPRVALHAGPTGLELYEEMMTALRARGRSPIVVLEIDPRQSSLILSVFGDLVTDVQRDYAGHERIVVLRGTEA